MGYKNYSDEKKREVAALMALHGNQNLVVRKTGIPKGTIQHWRKQEWWADLQKEISDEVEEEIRGKMRHVIDLALEQTEDRLKNGDVIYDQRRGEQVRVPMKGKDAMTVAAISYDKRRISLNLPTSISGSSGSTKQIQNLAEQFAELAKNFEYKKIREKESIPGEYQIEDN